VLPVFSSELSSPIATVRACARRLLELIGSWTSQTIQQLLSPACDLWYGQMLNSYFVSTLAQR
jgi:hypothetical protein